ncbi:MAG: glutamine-hydrolyzing carbamoyl-phosphate synthase small subunit [Gammaproteobacteria bacterium]|nr:glutamine-hydrolyzing carbamoyl-phosphate synthase small subunit [Gammaproteobacteria bacterium]
MTSIVKAILVLEDGSVFEGRSIGVSGDTTGEVVFNTAMTGYQEILTDPSYSHQIVTLTYPHIGNVGTNDGDEEAAAVHVSGLVIRDLAPVMSNWRGQLSLEDYLAKHNVVAIADIDTRRLTRILRDKGAMAGCIMAGNVDKDAALQKAKDFAGLKGLDLAQVVTVAQGYEWSKGEWDLDTNSAVTPEDLQYHVVAYDFGVKRNILRMLASRGCKVTVVPAKTPAKDVLAMNPDGVFLSNGPGDPEPCDYAITAIREILETDLPVFGICLGHQLLALACGAQTEKMKFGHHGANHPVQDLGSSQVMITSQNHGFAVAEESLPANLKATHRSLFDGSLQGIHRTDKPAFGFQGHPEASPGPHDIAPVFDHFIELIEEAGRA